MPQPESSRGETWILDSKDRGVDLGVDLGLWGGSGRQEPVTMQVGSAGAEHWTGRLESSTRGPLESR